MYRYICISVFVCPSDTAVKLVLYSHFRTSVSNSFVNMHLKRILTINFHYRDYNEQYLQSVLLKNSMFLKGLKTRSCLWNSVTSSPPEGPSTNYMIPLWQVAKDSFELKSAVWFYLKHYRACWYMIHLLFIYFIICASSVKYLAIAVLITVVSLMTHD